MYGRQTAPGVPGSFPLPNSGNPGMVYKANALHPAATAGASPRVNPLNKGPIPMAGKK